MSLDGSNISEIQEALLEAFPSKSNLEQVVKVSLDENLDTIAMADNLKGITFKESELNNLCI